MLIFSDKAAFSSTGPEPLYDILLEAGIDEAHAKVMLSSSIFCICAELYLLLSLMLPFPQVLGRTWAAEAAEYIARIKQTPVLGFPSSSSLQSSDYHLNLVMAQSGLSKLQEPTAIFEFAFAGGGAENRSNATNNSSSHVTGSSACSSGRTESIPTPSAAAGSNKLCVEFSHPELFAFFTQLERMQQQLDGLGSNS
jgi:hypothetical protein